MKIGYVLKIFPKISEKFVTNEILELIKMGHEIRIFSIYNPNEKIVYSEKIMHDEVLEYGLLDKTYYSPYIHRVIMELTGYASLLLNCQNNVLYSRLCANTADYFSKVIKEKNLDLDIIHAHFATEPTSVAMALSNKLGIPFTFMAHAYDIFINPDIKSLRKKCENTSAVMTPSFYNKEYLYNITGIDKNKISVIRACPNIDELKDIKRMNNEIDGKFTILSISRLVEKKGIRYGILAIKELVKEYPEIMYKIIGVGPLEKELKMLIKSLKIENNVRIMGNLNNNDLINEMNMATIFILPCIRSRNGDTDGIPVSLMESMYLQIPTISTSISGIPELIENKNSGLLVDTNNAEQLVDVIKMLLMNKDFRTKIGNNGRKKIENDFNIHNEVKKLVEIWSRL